jgi:DNA-directed DNA polymerase III PolC
MTPPFVHLHCHTNYSLLSGADRMDRLIEEAAKRGMKALAITDTNGLYGVVPFARKAAAAGVAPILGVELAAAGPGGEKRASCFEVAERAVVLARTRKGFSELCRLVTRRQLDEEARICELLLSAGPDLFLLTDSLEMLELLARERGGAGVLVELRGPRAAGSPTYVRERLAFSKRSGFPPVATNAVHFAETSGHEVHRVLVAIRENTNTHALTPGMTAPPGCWLKDAGQMERIFAEIPEALEKTWEVASACEVQLESGKWLLPRFPPLPRGETAFSFLSRLCFEGVERRYASITPPVLERLSYELSVIERAGFSDYFLIVWDIARFAREKGIPTIGRGSAASSIVSYALGITDVDPIRYDLYFERFLNPERGSPPDIDLDFSWTRRDEVLEHVYDTYGRDRVAMISTHVTFALRAAVRETGKALGIPEREITRTTSRLPHWGAESFEELPERFPECRGIRFDAEPLRSVAAMAGRILGFPRHLSIHPGGIVVSPSPLTDFVPLERAPKGFVVTQYDMFPVEDLGLLKIDILSQRSLSVFADVVRIVTEYSGSPPPVENPEALAKDGPTAALVREGRTIGCFYIESPAMRSLLVKLKVESFEMLTAASSVIRPGVAESGMMQEFIDRHNGKEEPVYLHPDLESLLRETYGVMIYQEDVIKVAHAISGMSLEEADLLRRAMSGKMRGTDAMEAITERFLSGAAARGVAETVAKEIWRQIESFARYAFCKAHSASYARLSYQVAWLKAHYPAEFMAAVISNGGGFYHTSVYVEEARRMGLRILLPHVNESEVEYTGRDGWIRVGLMQVKGLPEEDARAVVRARRKGGRYESLTDLLTRTRIDKKSAEKLILCGALDCFDLTRPELLWRLELTYDALVHGAGSDGALGKALLAREIEARWRAGIVPHIPDYTKSEKLRLEAEILDFTISVHPLTLFEKASKRKDITTAKELVKRNGRIATLVGWLISEKRIDTKDGKLMKFLSFEDTTGTFEVVLFPDAYQRFGAVIDDRGPYFITGRVTSDYDSPTVTATLLMKVPKSYLTIP